MKHFKAAPFLELDLQSIAIQKRITAEGNIYLKSATALQPHPKRMTERLVHWAAHKPDTIFLGQKDKKGHWQEITYSQSLEKVQKLAQWLLDQNVSVEQPVAIVAPNSIEHGLMALAALHIGIPYASISPAYVTKSSSYTKLKCTIDQLTPGIIMVSDGKLFERALNEVKQEATIVYLENAPKGNFPAFSFDSILNTAPTSAVEQAFQQIKAETIAKILFTSGSTGTPKGVINTHGNITTNWQQITQVFPFMANGFKLVDWLPWNHTFGGNHNFGLTLYHGGSLYIDEGAPTPSGIETTVQNLREHQPTIYFNVPKGFDELIPFLREDAHLRQLFFSNLKLLFYAGAGMPQHTWDALEELAFQTLGKRILIATGLGCTESSPSALFNTQYGSFAGMLGVPVPGMELKLVPIADKLEARYKGGNITPGYWRLPEVTAEAFDEEGFYKTGDALKFVDPEDPNEGMIFNGRIAEDFKLNTGTWVSVGYLRKQFIETANGLIQDVVITGHDQAYIGAIIFPEMDFVNKQLNIRESNPEQYAQNPALQNAVLEVLKQQAQNSTGSSTRIQKALIAPFTLLAEQGELTDKGSINQRAVIANREAFVEMLHTPNKNKLIIEI